MLNKVTAVAVAILVTLGLGGCGGDEKAKTPKAEGSTEATRSVIVALADSLPMDVFGNDDDTVCLVRAEGAEVTLRDAAGKIVGTKTLSGVGGGWQADAGCLWEVTFVGVTDSDFYEATLKAGDFERTGTAKAGDGRTKVVLEF